jgi:hypothetical protein
MGSVSPTDALICPHGALLPASMKQAAKRVAVPAGFWQFLCRAWRASQREAAKKELAKRAKQAAGAGGPDLVVLLDSPKQAEQGQRREDVEMAGAAAEGVAEEGRAAEGGESRCMRPKHRL